MNIVTRYFDKRSVVIIHWNEDEKDGEVFIGKKEERVKENITKYRVIPAD